MLWSVRLNSCNFSRKAQFISAASNFTSQIASKMSATDETNGAADAKDPSGFLSEIIGAPVTIKLNSGVVYKGSYGVVVLVNYLLTVCHRRIAVC